VVAVILMQATATISVSPSSGELGTGMVVTGSGFVPDDRVRVLWDGANLGGTVKVAADGAFTYSAGVPAGASPGLHTIEARGRDSGSATDTFTVFGPATTTTTTTTIPTTTTTTIATTAPTTTGVPKTTTTSAPTGATTTVTATTPTDGTEATEATVDSVTTITQDGASDDIAATTESEDEAGMGVAGFLAMIVAIAAAIGGGTLYMWKRSEGAPAKNDAVDTTVTVGPEPQRSVAPIAEVEVDGEEAGWARHPTLLEPPGHIEGIIGLAGVFLGFGATTEHEGFGKASVWRSRDGIRWEGIATFEDGRADLGTPWRGGLLVLGYKVQDRHRSACCWWSGDGARWEQLTQADDPILAGVTFDGAAVGDEGLVVYGRGPRGAGAWVSPDGRIWEPSSLRGAIDLVAAVPGGLVAFGRDPQERRPIVARSLDGMTWLELPSDSVFVFEAIGIASLVPFGGGLVAAGTDKMKGAATVWISEDGARWHRTPLEPDPGTSIEHLMVVDDRLLAVGADSGRRRTGKPGSVAIWESRDGVSWERLNVSQLFATATATAVAAVEDTVLIGGNLVAGHGSPWPEPTAVAWIHDPAHVPASSEPVLASS
jgi:hypothetical protein